MTFNKCSIKGKVYGNVPESQQGGASSETDEVTYCFYIKGWFDEFETNVWGPWAPQVEFLNILYKICQKVDISTIHLM